MLAKGLIAALVLTSTTHVEAEPPIAIEAIHDLNADLETHTHIFELDLAQPEIFTA